MAERQLRNYVAVARQLPTGPSWMAFDIHQTSGVLYPKGDYMSPSMRATLIRAALRRLRQAERQRNDAIRDLMRLGVRFR